VLFIVTFMRAFLIGEPGFIRGEVARLLRARGDEVQPLSVGLRELAAAR